MEHGCYSGNGLLYSWGLLYLMDCYVLSSWCTWTSSSTFSVCVPSVHWKTHEWRLWSLHVHVSKGVCKLLLFAWKKQTKFLDSANNSHLHSQLMVLSIEHAQLPFTSQNAVKEFCCDIIAFTKISWHSLKIAWCEHCVKAIHVCSVKIIKVFLFLMSK